MTTILWGWTPTQWIVAADYWLASKGKLPEASLKESVDVQEHYLEHHATMPPQPELKDHCPVAAVEWTCSTFAGAAAELERDKQLQPMSDVERRVRELDQAECGTRLWP